MTTAVSSEIVGKVQEAFNFSVDKFPLSGPDGMQTPWYAMFRSDNHTVVGSGSVTRKYVPHQTDDVLALVEAASHAFDGIADVQCHFRNGHYVAIQPSVEQRKAVFGTRDNVFPRVVINFGYNMEACRASIGYWRDLCRNMHIMRMARGTTVRIRHDSGLRHEMDDLVKTFGVLKERWANLSAVIDTMESRRVNMVEFLNAVYGEPDENNPRSVTMHRNRTEAIFRRLSNERFQAGRGNLGPEWTVTGWEAFNAIQGYVQHESIRRGSPSVLDRVMMAAVDSSVQQAERLALAV